MKRLLLGWTAGVCLLLAVWAACSAIVQKPALLPSPTMAFRLIANSSGTFLLIGERTAGWALYGLFLASFCAAVMVAIVGLFPKSEVIFYPCVVMLKASPAVAFAPLLMGLFGSGPQVKIAVAALISFFPMIVGGLDGLRRTPERLRLMGAAYGARRWAVLRCLTGPYALSGFLTGMKTSAPLSVVGAIVGEFVDATQAGRGGVGVYIASHASDLYMDHVFAGVVVATFIGIGFFAVTSFIARLAEGVLHLDK